MHCLTRLQIKLFIFIGNCDSVPNLSSPIPLSTRLKLRRASVSLDGAPCKSIHNNNPLSRYKNRHDTMHPINRQGSLQVNESKTIIRNLFEAIISCSVLSEVYNY